MFQNIRKDLKTYQGNWMSQGFWVMLVYRFGNWRYGIKPNLLRKPFSLLYKIAYKFVQILSGIELPCETKVGKGLRIDHFGGVIISGFAQIGENCVLRNGVVIGLKSVDEPAAPIIGNNVDIGAGAKVLGPINIGDGAKIGANAVVLSDVPAGYTAVGIPARLIAPKIPDLTLALSKATSYNSMEDMHHVG